MLAYELSMFDGDFAHDHTPGTYESSASEIVLVFSLASVRPLSTSRPTDSSFAGAPLAVPVTTTRSSTPTVGAMPGPSSCAGRDAG